MTVPSHSHLTPACVQALRDSLRPAARIVDHSGDIGVAYLTFLPSENAWAIHCYGRVLATSTDLYTCGAVLRNERAQPGWLRAVLDPAFDCRVEALNPWEASAERARVSRVQAENRARDLAAQEERQRRARAPHVAATDVDLTDLFGVGGTPRPRP